MADKNEITTMLTELLKELQKITLMTITKSGVKANSDLAKSVKYYVTKDGIQMEVAAYYPYVSSGRRPNIRRVPIKDLIPWIKQYGIRPRNGQTINQLAFAIQTSIYKRGIKGKNYVDKVETGVADYAAFAVADDLAVVIADDLVEMFAPVAI
jgi:hypothetical protein